MSLPTEEESTNAPKVRCVLDMSADEARRFFLKEDSYCTIPLPPYFSFGDVLAEVDGVLSRIPLTDCLAASPKCHHCEGVNHRILSNKDGRHAWRPLELIHPALYVDLVRRITKPETWTHVLQRFAEFQKDNCIACLSLPVESRTDYSDKEAQITHWWREVEQKSIELAMDYNCIVHTDVTDCYGALYTHSIAWALHSQETAKKQRKDTSLLGNVIDQRIQDMRHGQTNGIPQGAVLMDFVAELVLGYADLLLCEAIRQADAVDTPWKILRYRDDYRIFVNSSADGERILKALTEVLIRLGLQVHSGKTVISGDVIRSSIKEHKLDWICRRQSDRSLQKHLLIIHDHGSRHPNAGSLNGALQRFYHRLSSVKNLTEPLPLISIAVDIAYRNPRTHPICAAILSRLVSELPDVEAKREVIERIRSRFTQLPNTEHMDIWLQRISWSFDRAMEYDAPLCKLVAENEVREIWNSDWIGSKDLRNAVERPKVIDRDKLAAMKPIVPEDEIGLFPYP